MFDDFARYVQVARDLRLTIHPATPSRWTTSLIRLEGMLDGQRIEVTRSIGKNARVWFRGRMQPALDLGLAIRPSGVVESVKDLLGAVDVQVGDDALDRAFAVRADEPERARALLASPLGEALLACADLPIVVDDHGVVIERAIGFADPERDAAWIARSARGVAAVAAAVDAARAAIPAARDVAPLIPGLLALAREKGLAAAPGAPLRVVGALSGHSVWVSSVRRGKGQYALDVGVAFARPLALHLVVSTARTDIGTWFLGDDLSLDDPTFDAAFDVRGEERPRVLQLLDAEVRRELIAAGQGRTLQLDRFTLRVTDDAIDLDPAALPTMVQRLADLAATIARNEAAPPRQGYR